MGNNHLGAGEGCQGVGGAEFPTATDTSPWTAARGDADRPNRQPPVWEGMREPRRYAPDATVSSRRTVSRVSAHSRSGSESQMSPAPVPKYSNGSPGANTLDPERTDAYGELTRAAVGVDPAHTTAVRAAGRGLQRRDDAQRTGVGGAHDGAGRGGADPQLGPSGAFGELAEHRRDQVQQTGVCLDGAQLGGRSRSRWRRRVPGHRGPGPDHDVLGVSASAGTAVRSSPGPSRTPGAPPWTSSTRLGRGRGDLRSVHGKAHRAGVRR